MAPLYDILSAWPIIGHGRNQLHIDKAKLAMAQHAERAHYRINEIQSQHWRALAGRTAVRGIWNCLQELVESARSALERLERTIPATFPERISTSIRDGVRHQALRFEQAPVR